MRLTSPLPCAFTMNFVAYTGLSQTWDLDSDKAGMELLVVEVTVQWSGCVWTTCCTQVMIRAHQPNNIGITGPWHGLTACKPQPRRQGPWHGLTACKPSGPWRGINPRKPWPSCSPLTKHKADGCTCVAGVLDWRLCCLGFLNISDIALCSVVQIMNSMTNKQ